MLEFCPLCNKNGSKKKIILYQINLQEAVWLCEYSECPWPFGYQDFTFVSRRIGETSSSEWELCRPTSLKSAESIQISLTELGLDTPPVTPGSGNEIVQKDTVFGEGTCSVTGLDLNTTNVIQTKANFGLSKNNSNNKLRQSNASECGSVDTESTRARLSSETYASTSSIKSNDQDLKSHELLYDVKSSFRYTETSSEYNGGFSLGDDVILESSDKCLSFSVGFIDVCDTAEALTVSVFDVEEPTKDNLSIHESTVKCKKWLSDNTKGTVLGDHCYSCLSNKIADVPCDLSSEVLDGRSKSSSVENFNLTKKLPKIKSIERTNIKLAAAALAPNKKRLEDTNNSIFAEVEKSSSLLVADLTEVVKKETEQKITSTNSNHCIIVNDSSTTQSYPACNSSLQTREVETETVAMDGSLPIELSYELPHFVGECIIVPMSTDCNNKVNEKNIRLDLGQEPVVNNSVKSIIIKVEAVDCLETESSQPAISGDTEIQTQTMKKPLKRTVPKFAKYRGFNFGTLKKKSKTNTSHSEENIKFSLPNVPSPDNVSSCSDLTWTSETSWATTTTIDSKSESVGSSIDSNLKSALSVENCSSATSSSDLNRSNTFSTDNDIVLGSDFNLDQVLDDLLLSENDDLTQNFGDDWLTSLFH